MRKSYALVITMMMATGCALGPDFKKPEVEVPQTYKQLDTKENIELEKEWWKNFNDENLTRIVEEGLKANYDIKIALSSIEQARAFYGFTKSDILPSVTLQGSATRGDLIGTQRAVQVGNSFYLAPSVSWELDLWGKLRRANESAYNQFLGSAYAYEATRLSITSLIVNSYLDVLDFENRLKISKETLRSRRESYRIIEAKYKNGTIPEIDLKQSESLLAEAEASVPQFERAVVQAKNTLRVLLGKNPGDVIVNKDDALDSTVAPIVPSSIPASILTRRPDIAQSEASLRSANAEIGQAIGQALPSISLTGNLGFASNQFEDLFTNPGWSVGGQLLSPVFEFGKNMRRIDIAEEVEKQALFTYKKDIITAFSEVENSLIGVRTFNEQVVYLKKQVEALRKAAFLSQARYQAGVAPYTDVLEDERALFSAELNYSQVKKAQFSAYVDLYKSLGGGWDVNQEMEVLEEK